MVVGSGNLHVVGRNELLNFLSPRFIRFDNEHVPRGTGNKVVEIFQHVIEQFPALDRLGEEGDGARREGPAASVVRRNDAHRQVPRRQIALETLQDPPTLDIWQENIKCDGMWPVFASESQGGGSE